MVKYEICCDKQNLIHHDHLVCTNCGQIADLLTLVDEFDVHLRTRAKCRKTPNPRKTYFNQLVHCKFLRKKCKGYNKDIAYIEGKTIDECVALGVDISVYNEANTPYIMSYHLKEKLERLQQQIIEQQKIEKMQAELRENELKQENKLAIDGEKEIKGGVNTGELNKYKLLIQQKIQQNVNQQLCGLDYITLEFRISLMPTGELLGQPKMTKSSNITSCDDAVERAIIQSQPLPLPKDSGLFSKLKNLELKFHPNGVE